MKHFIALGGIGSRTLKAFAAGNAAEAKYYYIDSDKYNAAVIAPAAGDMHYIVDGMHAGTGAFRQIGKNAVRYDIFTNKLGGFFAGIAADEDAEAIIVTSSFGGFGGAVAGEIAEYLEALMWKSSRRSCDARCRIIAFSHEGLTKGWPKAAVDHYAMNTISMVEEMAGHSAAQKIPAGLFTGGNLFRPHYRFCLINTESMPSGELWKVLELDEAELRKLDVCSKYAAEINTVRTAGKAPQVFVSYSSKDQTVADKLVDALDENGIGSWIATRSIREGSYAAQIIRGIREADVFVVLISKNSIASEQVKNEIDRAFARLRDGMRIIPFILDDAPLDDECAYYLCRQEFFFGNRPPLDLRIKELAQTIKEMLI